MARPGAAIVGAIAAGDLTRGRITDSNLPEILDPIEKRGGDPPARDTLGFITESRGVALQPTTRDDLTRGLAI